MSEIEKKWVMILFSVNSLCYKIGKNKRLSDQADNKQYGSQPNEISLNPNTSYTNTTVPSQVNEKDF